VSRRSGENVRRLMANTDSLGDEFQFDKLAVSFEIIFICNLMCS
jgi:hypothetical protein